MKLLSFTILATFLLALFIPNIDAKSNVRGGHVEEKKNIDGGHRALAKGGEKMTCEADCEAAEEDCKKVCNGDTDPTTHHDCKHACKNEFEGCKVDCNDSTPTDSDVPTTTDSDSTPTEPADPTPKP
jgi:hypothetical protein